MTQSNSLTPRQIDSLKAYKKLLVEDRCVILEAITRLKMMAATRQIVTSEVVLEKLTATGHLDIALDCYAAELLCHREWS